jgi:5-formyltetrahydrofolate cyclo-ligase
MNKVELREMFKEKRKAISPGELVQLSNDIVHNTLSSFQFSQKMVSLFLPIERQKEINTYTLWEKIMGIDGDIAVPKMTQTKGEMKHFLLINHSQLAANSLGIPEPQNGKVIAATKIDIVIVPLLCFDLEGNRVGYGGGYYDRFLKKCHPNCKFIGLSLFDPVERIEDTNEDDVRLHACITPEKVYRF